MEIRDIIKTIKAGLSGGHVPPPPRFFNDAGDLMDIHRTVGWMLILAVGMDEESETAFSARIYDKDVSTGYRIGCTQELGFADAPDVLKEILSGLNAEVIEDGPQTKPFDGLSRVSAESVSDVTIESLLRVRATLKSEKDVDGYPDLSDDARAALDIAVKRVVGAMSDNKLGVLLEDSRDHSGVIIIPKAGKTVTPELKNALARVLVQFSETMKRSVDNAVVFPAMTARREEERNRKNAELTASIKREETRILEKHADTLSGTEAGRMVAARLRGERDLPCYPSRLARSVNAERAAFYARRNEELSTLKDFLGENSDAVLHALIRTDLSFAGGVEQLVETKLKGLRVLDDILSNSFTPSPQT